MKMGLGAFEIPGDELIYSINTICPKPECKSENVIVTSRDPVWEETWYRCCQCGHEWCKG